jgi:hypothetical protein
MATNERMLWNIGKGSCSILSSISVTFTLGTTRGMSSLVPLASMCPKQWATFISFSSHTMNPPFIKITNVKSFGDVQAKINPNRKEKAKP